MALFRDNRPLLASESLEPGLIPASRMVDAAGGMVLAPAPAGSVGPKGDKGDTGPVGPKGDKGDTGATGPAGSGTSNLGWINVKDYGAVGDGTTDDSAAIDSALKACQGGKVVGWVATAFGSGYTWANSMYVYRGNSTMTGEGIVMTDGSSAVNGAIIHSPGGNNVVFHMPVSTTAGSLTVTCLAGVLSDYPYYIGMPIDEPGLSTDSYFHHVISSTQFSLNQPCPFSSAYCVMTFGIPRAVIVGDGTGATGELILSGKTLFFPPGVYKCSGGITCYGQHNMTVLGYGATIKLDNSNNSGIYVDYSCRYLTFRGLNFVHPGTAWMPRDPGCGVRNSGWFTQLIDCRFEQCPEFGILYGGPFNTSKYSRGGAIINCHTINTKGDGIHISSGFRDVIVQGNFVESPGDDAIAVVNDVHTTMGAPLNISVVGNQIRNGGFRGIVVIVSKKVLVNGNIIDGTSGFGIQATDEGKGSPYINEDVTITNNIVRRVGYDGAGYNFVNRDAILMDHTINGVVADNEVNECSGFGLNFDTVTNITFADNHVVNANRGEKYFNALTTCKGTWWESGYLKALGTSGTITTLATP